MIKKENLLTVKELREALNTLDASYDDNIIVLSKDSEGNEYKVVEKNNFMAIDYKLTPKGCGCCGDIHIRKLTDELIKHGYTEEDLTDEESIDCVILYPYY